MQQKHVLPGAGFPKQSWPEWIRTVFLFSHIFPRNWLDRQAFSLFQVCLWSPMHIKSALLPYSIQKTGRRKNRGSFVASKKEQSRAHAACLCTIVQTADKLLTLTVSTTTIPLHLSSRVRGLTQPRTSSQPRSKDNGGSKGEEKKKKTNNYKQESFMPCP